MDYATRSDLSTLGLPGDWVEQATTVQQDSALLRACAVANSYLKQAFTLPVLTWGLDLTGCVVDIATYYLATGAIGFDPSEGANSTIIDRFNAAISWLEKVAIKKATPTDITDSTPTGSTRVAVMIIMESDPLIGW